MEKTITCSKVILIAAIATAVFILTGSTDKSSAAEKKQGKKQFEIVMIAKTEGLAWFDAMKRGVKEFNDTHSSDVKAYQHSPEGADVAKQAAMIEDYIAKGVDAICIVPNDPKALIPVVKKAKKAGIIVVIHEGADLIGSADFDLEVINNVALGALMGKALGNAMGGKGKYASTVGGLTMQTHMDWWNGGTNYIKEHFPNIKLINAQPYEDHDDAKIGYDICKQILQSTPDIKGFIGYTVESHSSMCRLLKANNNKNVKVTGLAVPSALREYIKEGWTQGAFGNSPVDAGYATVNVAYMLLKGRKIKDGDVLNLGKPGLEKCTVKRGLIQGHAELEFTKQNVDKYDF
jgi:simple sugar transport system substrate-binding protein